MSSPARMQEDDCEMSPWIEIRLNKNGSVLHERKCRMEHDTFSEFNKNCINSSKNKKTKKQLRHLEYGLPRN